MVHLISFASKEPVDYTKSQRRLNKSAKRYGRFDKIMGFRLRHIDRTFRSENASILSEVRGCGYWLWKPYFIYNTLTKMNDGDILFYCDSGSEFISDPLCLLSLVSYERPIALFKTHDHANSVWTKRDAFAMMGCESPEYGNAEQVAAGFQIYYKCEASIRFVNEYLTYCRNRNILTDDPSVIGPEAPGFREHRHDQSVLSLLAVKHAVPVYRDPTQYGNGYVTVSADSPYPQILDHHRQNKRSFLFRVKRKAKSLLGPFFRLR